MRRRILTSLAAIAAVAGAAGIAMQPAGAASSGTVVTMNVLSATELDASSCATGTAATSIGTVLPSVPATSGDCTLVFGSTNDSSQLRLSQLDGGLRAMYGESTGTYDTSFDTTGFKDLDVSPWPVYYDIAAYPGGGWIVAGEADAGSGWEFQVTRLTETGGTSWSVNRPIPSSGDSMPFDVEVDAQGRIVLVGHEWPTGNMNSVVMRLNADGSLDTSFNASGTPGWKVVQTAANDQQFNAVGHQSDGKILAGGFDDADGDAKLYRLDSAGAVDTSFGTGGFVEFDDTNATTINDIEVLDDDSIIVAGNMYHGFLYDAFIVKLDADGAVDNTWGGGLQWIDTDLSVADPFDLFLHLDYDPFNGITWLASSYDGGATTDTLVARLLGDGTLDPDFGGGDGVVEYDAVTGVDEFGDAVVAAYDGTAYVASHRSSDGRVYVRHVTETGAQDTKFGGDGDWDSGAGWTDNQYRVRMEMDRDGRLVGVGLNWIWRLDAPTIPDYASGSDDFTSATGTFGACLRSLAGGDPDATTWTVDAGNDCATGALDEWNPIVADAATSGSKVARRATPGTATATLRFGARAPDGAAPGGFLAPVRFDVLAPDAP